MTAIIWIIVAFGSIVFMCSVHLGIGCMMDSFKPSRPPVPPSPLKTPTGKDS